MTLSYSNLNEVFPDITYTRKDIIKGDKSNYHQEIDDVPPIYSESKYDEILENLNTIVKKFKDNDKLRIMNDDLTIDNRYFKSIRRRICKDDRTKVFEKLRELYNNYSNEVTTILDLLCKTTYRNDKKFIKDSKELMGGIQN